MNQFREFSPLSLCHCFSVLFYFFDHSIPLPRHYPAFQFDKLMHARINVKSIKQSLHQSAINTPKIYHPSTPNLPKKNAALSLVLGRATPNPKTYAKRKTHSTFMSSIPD